jgi:hypothetical protein
MNIAHIALRPILSAYNAFFLALVRVGMPRPLFNALWWLLGGPMVIQLALWTDFYGFGTTGR